MIVHLRRLRPATFVANRLLPPLVNGYCSRSWPSFNRNEGNPDQLASTEDVRCRNQSGGVSGLSSIWDCRPEVDSREIQVVDSDTWSVCSGLANVSKGTRKGSELRLLGREDVGEFGCRSEFVEEDLGFDEVEDMRIHGGLFYKVERNSMEFEEYSLDFHGKKSKTNKNGVKESNKKGNRRDVLTPSSQKSSKNCNQTTNKKGSSKDGSLVNKERLLKTIEDKFVVCSPDESVGVRKKPRTPTFNQLTGPFHEPFCLDIFVSNASVRACVVHRVTSKVVAVAHSISKDMKFDVGSTKSVVAAASVGKVLAQRALEDDIHDVIYTPRKGDQLEGKLKLVLQSIIDNGVNVKVRLKQRNPSKPGRSRTT